MKALLILLLLTGCASDRYLTEAEDAKMRETCEAAGCVTVPLPLMEQLLKRRQGIAI